MKLRIQRDGRELDFDGAVPFGKGGEAAVFAVPTTGWAAKMYHKYVSSRGDKLRVMVANPPDDPTVSQGHVSIAWPQDLLVDVGGRIAGYVMPMVTGMRPLADFYHPKTRRMECPLFHYYYLAVTARNLATAVRALHRRGYVLGDVNESNILAAETAMVTLVDTDSFQVREPQSGKVHRCIVGSEFYTPPEMQGVDFASVERGEEQDLFGLGVLLFQLLMEGTHPFQIRFTGAGEPPQLVQLIRDGRFPHDTGSAMWQPPPLAPPFGMLDFRLRRLFTRCFVNGHRDPQARPTADEWRVALMESSAALVHCQVNPNHRHWPHAEPCPWCQRAAKLGGRDPFPSQDQVKEGKHLAPPPKKRPPALTTKARSGHRQTPSPAAQQRTQATPVSHPVAAPQKKRGRPPKKSSVLVTAQVIGMCAFILLVVLFGAWIWVKSKESNSNLPVARNGISNKDDLRKPAVTSGRKPAGASAPAGGAVERRERTEAPAIGTTRTVVLDATKAGDQRTLDLGGGTTLDLLAMPPGGFTMGSAADGTQHKVTLTQAFWLGRTEVTQAQWQAVMGGNPSHFKGPDRPVENVNRNEAAKFCQKLDGKALLPDGWRFALPTEAQWEYACRAGTSGDDPDDLDECAWHARNSGNATHPVATKNANPWGLYDMRGNVAEWCADWYSAYQLAPQTDPTGPLRGTDRVCRGASCNRDGKLCTSAYRERRQSDFHGIDLGFRVAVVPTTAVFSH